MIPENRIPTHPGKMLLEEFLTPMEIPQTKLAEKLGIPVQRVNEIVNGKRGITPETAWLFADAFGTSPQFWMNLQANYDLAKARPEKHIKRLTARGLTSGSDDAGL
jgi:addiction module HigA family antidote